MTTGVTSSGSQNVGSDGTGGEYKSKTWTGQDDPINKSAYNPYTCVLQNSKRVGSKIVDTRNGEVQYVGDYILMFYDPGIGGDYNNLLVKLSDKIRGHQFNAAIALSESHKSLETIVNSLAAVRRLFNAVVHRDFPEVLRSLASLPGQIKTASRSSLLVTRNRLKIGDIPSAWLSLQYGWKPVLSDIYQLCRAMYADISIGRGLTFSATTRRTESRNVVRDLNYDVDAAAHYSADLVTTVALSIRVTLKEPFDAARALGLQNPAAVFWEKVPFSFVWDWAQPIGQFLDNWGQFNDLAVTYELTSYRKCAVTSKMITPYVRAWPYNGPSNTEGSFKGYKVFIDRTVGTQLPMILPDFKSWDKTFSRLHILNAVALVWAIIAPGSNRGLNISGRGSWR